MNRKKIIDDRLQSLKARIPHGAQLVAVSKHTGVDDIMYALESGQQDFGENRVDALISKAQYFHTRGHTNVRWHFIGKIQTNKINRLLKAPGLVCLHSVDSQKLLEALYQREINFPSSRLPFFLQINTTAEPQKQGPTDRDDIYRIINLCLKNDHAKIQLAGLMTMASLNSDPRPCFRKLAQLRDNIANDFQIKNLKLSMGMGSDFSIALEEGSDIVRIGRLIFDCETS